MKLPIPLLLYTVSSGLVGIVSWHAYEMLPLLKKETRDAATGKGIAEGTDRLAVGKGSGPVSADWQYTKSTLEWWSEFKDANFLGKLPPKPEEPKPPGPDEPEKPTDLRPLDQIIELVSLVYDSKDQGKGEVSHVIVRYKPEANVQPPEWYVREMSSPGTPAAMPRDVAPPRTGGNPGGPQGRPNPVRPATPMPSSQIGRDTLQKVWIQGDGNPRREPRLWPPFDDIKLVRVADDAQSAFFVRTPTPPKAGEPAAASKEEELLKTAWGMDQELKREVNRLNGRDGVLVTGRPSASAATGQQSVWVENEETNQIGKVRHIGRKDEKRFREGADDLLSSLNVDTYVGSSGTRGLRVLNIEPELAARFGVAAGEVLLSVNDRSVTTKAQARQFGKGEYEKGVRTFVTKWLAGGQVVERIYQAPDR